MRGNKKDQFKIESIQIHVTFIQIKYLNLFLFCLASCVLPLPQALRQAAAPPAIHSQCLLFVVLCLPPQFVLPPTQMAHLQLEVAVIGVLQVQRRLTGVFLPTLSGGKSQMVSTTLTPTRSRRIATVATRTSSLSRCLWAQVPRSITVLTTHYPRLYGSLPLQSRYIILHFSQRLDLTFALVSITCLPPNNSQVCRSLHTRRHTGITASNHRPPLWSPHLKRRTLPSRALASGYWTLAQALPKPLSLLSSLTNPVTLAP